LRAIPISLPAFVLNLGMLALSKARHFLNKSTTNLGKRVFSCPQCRQKLRVPIRPGKVLEVSCSNCQSGYRLDFKVPLIECFRWQSGKSLKHNLINFSNRFWNLSLDTKLLALLIMGLVAMTLSLVLSGFFSLMAPQVPFSSMSSNVWPLVLPS